MERCFNNDVYRLIFENCLDAVLVSSLDGKIYRANRAACELFRRTEEELCAAGRAGIIDEQDPKWAAALSERAETGSIRAQLNYVWKDGSKFVGDTTSVIFNDQNDCIWTVLIIRDITKFIQIEKTLRKIKDTAFFSKYDDLTKILNRKSFINKLKQEMARSKRENSPLSLLLVDIDYFKKVNDMHGHPIGDTVLKCCVLRLIENLRIYDILGRYGGDEFIICLPNTSREQAADISERLRRLIEEMEIEHNSEIIKVTASFGVAFFDAESGEDIDSIIARVDDMMYHAKSKRNSVYGI